jgi:cysteine synthase A
VGISSGANFLGALMKQNEMGGDAIVATVFPDDNKKYLSTDLLGEESAKDGFLAPDVELEGFRGFKRVCATCCDPYECTQTHPLGDSEVQDLPPCPRRGEPGFEVE